MGEIQWRQVGRTEFAVPKSATFQTGDDSDLPYYLTVTIENTDGTPQCTKLLAEQRPGGPAVTAEGLRSVPVARIVEHFAPMLIMRISDPAKGISSGLSLIPSKSAVRAAAGALADDARHGRRRITDDDLRQLADVVVRAEAKGTSYITLAELEMGITRDQARQWKRKAIAGGFLPPTKGQNR